MNWLFVRMPVILLIFGVWSGVVDGREYLRLFEDPEESYFEEIFNEGLEDMGRTADDIEALYRENGFASELYAPDPVLASDKRYAVALGLQTFFMFAGLAALIAGVNRIADHLTQKETV